MPKEAIRIVAAFASLHIALVGEERRTLQEQHAESSQRHITDPSLGILAAAWVW